MKVDLDRIEADESLDGCLAAIRQDRIIVDRWFPFPEMQQAAESFYRLLGGYNGTPERAKFLMALYLVCRAKPRQWLDDVKSVLDSRHGYSFPEAYPVAYGACLAYVDGFDEAYVAKFLGDAVSRSTRRAKLGMARSLSFGDPAFRKRVLSTILAVSRLSMPLTPEDHEAYKIACGSTRGQEEADICRRIGENWDWNSTHVPHYWDKIRKHDIWPGLFYGGAVASLHLLAQNDYQRQLAYRSQLYFAGVMLPFFIVENKGDWGDGLNAALGMIFTGPLMLAAYPLIPEEKQRFIPAFSGAVVGLSVYVSI